MSGVGPRPGNFKKRKLWVPGERKYFYLRSVIGGKRTGKVYTEEEWNASLDLKNERRKNISPLAYVRYKFSSHKSTAKKRNLEFTLDKEFTVNAILKQVYCALCGRRFVHKSGDHESPSIDRIDSDRGYTPDNVQYVSSRVNIMKGNLTTEDFIALNKDIYNTELLNEYRRLYND
jgi:hypothetical protein